MSNYNVNKKQLYKEVLVEIKNYIKDNNFKKGDKLLDERGLAKKFGVSRGTLKEALRILEEKGVLKVYSGGGRFINCSFEKKELIEDAINEFEKTNIFDMYEMRKALETKIVELSIKRANDNEIKKIKKSIKPKGEYDNFHLIIAKTTKNNAFINIINYNIELMKIVNKKMNNLLDRKEERIDEHWNIYEAIKNRNTQRAKKNLMYHLNNVEKQLIELSNEKNLLGGDQKRYF